MGEDQKWDPIKVRHQVAADISDIETLWASLHDEAANRADATDWPGGEAMSLLAPVANLEAWGHKYEAKEQRGFSTIKGSDYALDQDDEGNVLLVLATWEDAIRDEREQPTDTKASVPRACRYLRDSLDWCLSTNEDGDLRFLGIDHLADDVRDARKRLEALLKAGEQVDRGVECLRCDNGSRLIREWKADKVTERWRCPTCHKDVSGDAYRLAVKADWMARAEWLPAAEMKEEHDIGTGTLQGWAAKGRVAKRKDVGLGRMTYNVADAKACRDGTGDSRGENDGEVA